MLNKILVTGGSGFIGSNLVKHLLEKNYNVINVDKLNYSSIPDIYKSFTRNKRYKFINADLLNTKKIFKILKKYKPQVIFNLAAETHVDRSIDSPSSFIKNNILGSLNLIENIKNCYLKSEIRKLKLIHISTDEVYGNVLKKNQH